MLRGIWEGEAVTVRDGGDARERLVEGGETAMVRSMSGTPALGGRIEGAR